MATKRKTTQFKTITLVTLFGFIIFIVLILMFAINKPKIMKFDTTNFPTLGNPNAKVEIIEFADFQCPACKMLKDETINRLKRDYILPGKVKFSFVTLSFLGKDSAVAQSIGKSIYEQDKNSFWDYYDEIYDNQGEEGTEWLNFVFVKNLMEKKLKNIDFNIVKKELDEKKHAKVMKSEYKIVKKHGIDIAPTLVINGKILTMENSFDYNYVKNMIEEELK